MNSFTPSTNAADTPGSIAAMPGDIAVSFEYFPPATSKAENLLARTSQRLSAFAPSFVSMTYGAGGSTRERSLAAIRKLVDEGSAPVAAHLTCVDASRDQVDDMAMQFHASGIRHIVALRGDGGEPGQPFTAHPQGYANAAELVAGLRKLADFEISVAAYPEVHPDAQSAQHDLDNLKRKLDAGATRAITQFFFSADACLRFRDRAVAAGIDAPIVPGILPITNFAQTCKFAGACGAQIPAPMKAVFEGLDDHPETRKAVSIATTAELCRKLYEGGMREFHFYTLNRAEQIEAICHLMGLRVPARVEAAA
ncbi:methylenetetrahydrofolate reductase [NAD(P)H] [Aurantiacibacter rhizosphaerae]|uniref:Methylenetetrahydrofolate reductase n=1 Tax=Aurantiacibacter rhizosphaerae TaxID=2691582 RepID=A0A844XGT3_9SPHN|nr:methylenetetrahydrofolate reductase [NAD(P)H] [Aurantiacibacter rhizosphaerae]MWV28949.1 methylenetetrahydrofolate reductase [NAD(P)H] [Aurantiacibacter rhizosphaerae]